MRADERTRWRTSRQVEEWSCAITFTGRTFAEGPADYDIAVAFDSSDYNFTFGNSSVSYSYTGTIAGFDGATDGGGEIDFVWTKAPATAYGSNYMTFDNITVVPEPSAAVLSGLAASLLLVRRRR